MLKEDPATYCLKLLTRFENEFGMDSYVDYITIQPYHWFGVYSGSYVTDKNGDNIIYLPYTKDKDLLRGLFFHELGHAIFQNQIISKRLLNILNPYKSNDSLTYRFRLLKNIFEERREGVCSAYSLVDQEEEFSELFSFSLCNRHRRRFYQFDNETIDLKAEPELHKKVSFLRRYLSLESL
jgi:hypothetical protein